MRRRASAFVVSFLCLSLVLGMPNIGAKADAPPPAAPTNLVMAKSRGAAALPPGSWINVTQVDLRFQAQVAGGALTPEVEVEPFDVAFNGQANHSGPSLTSSGVAHVAVDALTDGTTYHWQARLVDQKQNTSPWVPFAAQGSTRPDLGVDQGPPSRPVITSPTNPEQNLWYHNTVVRLRWRSRDAISGINGYTYALERQPHVIPPGPIYLRRHLKLTNLPDGVWFLALRAVDRAGNWSPTATFRVQLDRQAPRVTWLSPSRFTFNPFKGPTTVRFSVNKDASVQLGLYRVGDRTPTQTYSFPSLRAGKATTVTWSGKDARGNPVAKGYYFFSVRAVDHADNLTRSTMGGILVEPQLPMKAVTGQPLFADGGKLIIVSLSRQTLYAYDGVKLVLQTYVTTGNPDLPTPPGNYTVLARYHPWEFISPWPPGSPFWYPPSWSQYALLFRDGGYFLHDAPWRSVFGPGSDGPGQPGSNYGGTHGCINIPPDPMVFLWDWTPVGTPVEVVP